MADNRERILEAAIDVMGSDPDAGMGEVARAAGVVRRTVYGHFPTRRDLVRALARRAADDVLLLLEGGEQGAPDAVWAGFVHRLWPLMRRYRVLVSLRRGEFGADIHSVLASVDDAVVELVARGQREGAFGDHLAAAVLAPTAWMSVFSLADRERAGAEVGAVAAAVTSLLLLGVSRERADVVSRGL